MPLRIAVVALLCLVVLGSLRAEEEPQESPRARLDRVASAFPAPSESAGFVFEGRIVAGGVSLGKCTLSAVVDEATESRGWKTVQKVAMDLGPQSMSLDSVTRLTSGFGLIEGSETEVESGVESVRNWERTESGYLLRLKTGEEVEEVTVPLDGPALSGLASTILFCRLARVAGGEFEIPALSLDPDEGEDYVRTTRLTFGGTIDWHGVEAALVTGVQADRTLHLAFHPETHEPLGLRMKLKSGGEVELTATAEEPDATPPEEDFTPPASTPEKAALITALAFGSGNGELLAEIAHWPSLHRAFLAEIPDPTLTEEVLRARLVASLNQYARKKPRDLVIKALGMIRSDLQVEMLSEEHATVRFPASFRSMVMEFRKFGEAWLLVAMPVS